MSARYFRPRELTDRKSVCDPETNVDVSKPAVCNQTRRLRTRAGQTYIVHAIVVGPSTHIIVDRYL